jgi:hypothetical protein
VAAAAFQRFCRLDPIAECVAAAISDHKMHTSSDTPVHFVTHGAGALVLRRAFQYVDWEDRNIRIVMLGPPNRGSRHAREAARNPAWKWALARGLLGELGCLPPSHFDAVGDVPKSAAVMVVAGSSRSEADGVVSVSETVLNTPHAQLQVPVSHLGLLVNRHVLNATVSFLIGPTPSEGLKQAITDVSSLAASVKFLGGRIPPRQPMTALPADFNPLFSAVVPPAARAPAPHELPLPLQCAMCDPTLRA